MLLSRKDFIKRLLAAGISLTVDPEQLLWVPGAKKIFLPTDAQVKFFNIPGSVTLTLVGVPYHTHDGFTRQWLGFYRTKDWKNEKPLAIIKGIEE